MYLYKKIAWHLPSPSLLDSYTAADFINSPLTVVVVFSNPKPNITYIFFPPFKVSCAFGKTVNAQAYTLLQQSNIKVIIVMLRGTFLY